jgi:hypothetical protein
VIGDHLSALDQFRTFALQSAGTSHELTPVVREILEGVGYRVPLFNMREWYLHVRELRREVWNDPSKRQEAEQTLADLSNAFVRHSAKENHHVNRWARLVALLTVESFASKVTWPYEDTFLRDYVPGEPNNLIRIIADEVRLLFEQEAESVLAGPLAFFCVARVVRLPASDPYSDGLVASSVVQALSATKLRTYFEFLAVLEDSPAQLSQLGAVPQELVRTSRCYQYLQYRVLARPRSRKTIKARWQLGKMQRLRLFLGGHKQKWTPWGLINLLTIVCSLAILLYCFAR